MPCGRLQLWTSSREISHQGFMADRRPNAAWIVFLWRVKKVLKSQRKVIFRFLWAHLKTTITAKHKPTRIKSQTWQSFQRSFGILVHPTHTHILTSPNWGKAVWFQPLATGGKQHTRIRIDRAAGNASRKKWRSKVVWQRSSFSCPQWCSKKLEKIL